MLTNCDHFRRCTSVSVRFALDLIYELPLSHEAKLYTDEVEADM